MNDFMIYMWKDLQWVNSLKPRDSYMRHQTKSPLLQIMTCRLFAAKPLSEPIRIYQWKLKHFHSRKCVSKCRLRNSILLVSGSRYKRWSCMNRSFDPWCWYQSVWYYTFTNKHASPRQQWSRVKCSNGNNFIITSQLANISFPDNGKCTCSKR